METDLQTLPPKTPADRRDTQSTRSGKAPAPCAGVFCFRGEDILLIQRGTAPRKGEWSIPGGHIEPGETAEAAAIRELREETSVTATLGPKIAVIDAEFEGKAYILHDFLALWTSGEPFAGDDAKSAEFVSPEKLAQLDLWPKTREIIELGRRTLPAFRRSVEASIQSGSKPIK